MILRSAYYSDFKGGPKVVFWGDSKAIEQLANLLRASAIGTGPLALGSFCEAVDGRAIIIQTAVSQCGMQPYGSGFEWNLNAQTMADFAERLDILAESNRPGHQYLECGVTGEIAVMASCGEYPADLKPCAK